MKDTMKTQNRLWITLIAFGLFALIFCRWIYVKDTVRETQSFNETVHLETLQSFESEIKTERIVLPVRLRINERFYLERRILVWKFYWMAKKFINMEEKRMHQLL